MEIIKRQMKIGSGKNFYLKFPLYQNIEDIGLLSDLPYDTKINKCSGGLPLNFMVDGVVSNYFKSGDIIEYYSDSKLEFVKSYDKDNQYIINFDIKKESYDNYLQTNINGVDRVVSINDDEIIYTTDAKKDITIGTSGQTTGIQYTDNPNEGVNIPNELNSDITTTKVHYKSEGWNVTNASLSPQIQKEYLLGIINEPEVKSDVFIDRSTFSVIDKHLKLSEVKSLEHLTRYGNGFYNINRD